jgi:hypothetical protein
VWCWRSCTSPQHRQASSSICCASGHGCDGSRLQRAALAQRLSCVRSMSCGEPNSSRSPASQPRAWSAAAWNIMDCQGWNLAGASISRAPFPPAVCYRCGPPACMQPVDCMPDRAPAPLQALRKPAPQRRMSRTSGDGSGSAEQAAGEPPVLVASPPCQHAPD